MGPLDRVDLDLLNALADDHRATVVALAERLGLSRNTVQARLARLERGGVFQSFERAIPPVALGLPIEAMVSVTVRPHPVFTRDGLNLRVTVPVTFTEAALGATIEVPTLGGDPVKLRVAPGTPSGRVLRVKGRGVHTAKGTGDLLAEVQVAVPAHLDDQAKEALERFHELEPKENPRADLMAKARE